MNVVVPFPSKNKDTRPPPEDMLAVAAEFLKANPMRYVAKTGCYFVKKLDGEWIPVKPVAMKPRYSEWNLPRFQLAITTLLQDAGQCYADVTYSFSEVPRDILNLMDRSRWLEPEAGDYHWLFDVLMQSLGGGKQPNIEHLEHVITYKYMKPETFTLPCLMIHGEGGVGKNLLVDCLLRTVFAGQTLSALAGNIIGNFNGLVKGKTVVLIDESDKDTTDDAKMRHLLQKEKFPVNDKGIPQYEMQNTPLYFVSSNKSGGGVWLNRSHADRRYSVLHVRKGQPLEYWIARHERWIPAEQETMVETDLPFARATEWLKANANRILEDKAQVANWIGAMFLRHADKPEPVALHGEDFHRLMDIQKPAHEMICEAVFHAEDFTHIRRVTLYRGYKAICKDNNRLAKGDQKFFESVREWLAICKLPIVEDKWRQSTGSGLTYRGNTVRGWYATDKTKETRNKNNDDVYIEANGYKDTWAGPEI